MLVRHLVVAAALCFACAANAAPGKDKKAPKPAEIRVCPQTNESVKGEPAGSEVVGKYKVFFCCAGCREEFAKLSKTEKQAKVAELAKKAKPGKKG